MHFFPFAFCYPFRVYYNCALKSQKKVHGKRRQKDGKKEKSGKILMGILEGKGNKSEVKEDFFKEGNTCGSSF